MFGTYGGAEAHVGIVKSGNIQLVTKGDASLSLGGTGSGIDLGIGFGNFVIKRRESGGQSNVARRVQPRSAGGANQQVEDSVGVAMTG